MLAKIFPSSIFFPLFICLSLFFLKIFSIQKVRADVQIFSNFICLFLSLSNFFPEILQSSKVNSLRRMTLLTGQMEALWIFPHITCTLSNEGLSLIHRNLPTSEKEGGLCKITPHSVDNGDTATDSVSSLFRKWTIWRYFQLTDI